MWLLFAVLACRSSGPLEFTVGPEGGAIEADEVRMTVPTGAVSEEVTITAASGAPDGLTPLSPVIEDNDMLCLDPIDAFANRYPTCACSGGTLATSPP